MKSKLIGFYLLIIFMFSAYTAGAQGAFTNENISYKYDPYLDVWFDYHITESADSFRVFFRLDFTSPVDLDKNFHLYYELRNGYADKSSGKANTLNVAANCIYHEYSSYIFSCTVAKDSDNNLLVFHISKKGGDYHYLFDVPLRLASIYNYSGLTLYSSSTGVPVIRPFIHVDDSIFIQSDNPAVNRIYLYWYNHDFPAADPPMYLFDKNISKKLDYDSLFTVDPGEDIVLPGRGLYFIQSDTSSLTGISVRCEESHYPKFVMMEDIFEPVIYLTTHEELERLKNSTDKRKTFETWWLNLTKSPERAKRMIRAYYQRVEEANNFFTTYKEGWKTDMGMIYIFFGPPDAVFNDGSIEKWYYAKNGNIPAVDFTFIRLRNVFSPRHYILERDESYRSQWYRRIESWRRGSL